MIYSIRVVNFQNISDETLHLSPGLNVIVGKSGMGKSARTIRPLDWVVNNNPPKGEFRRWGTDETRVEITLDGPDGNPAPVTVSRIRNNKFNGYTLKSTGPLRTFAAVGQKVPDEIRRVLNLGPVNFQSQHDPVYLLGLKPADLARELNSFAGLDQIDSAYAFLAGEYGRARSEMSSMEAQSADLESSLEEYSGLDVLEVLVDALVLQENSADLARETATGIHRMSDQLRVAQGKLDRVSRVGELGDVVGGLWVKSKHLGEIQATYHGIRGYIEKLKCQLDYTGLDTAVECVTRLQSRVKVVPDGMTQVASIRGICNRIVKTRQRLEGCIREVGMAQREWDEQLPEVCPLCGRSGQSGSGDLCPKC